MSVFHDMDKDSSSDITLPEFVEFCQNVQSKSHVVPHVVDTVAIPPSSQDADVLALKNAAGEAMKSTVQMLKMVMQDSDLHPTPGRLLIPDQNNNNNPAINSSNSNKRDRVRELQGARACASPGSPGSRAGSLTPRSRSLTPMASTVGTAADLSSCKGLALKLNGLASFLLTESRASTLRDISRKITKMCADIEDGEDDNDDDDEWGGGGGDSSAEKVAELMCACREWKVAALAEVRGEIHSLEDRVSHIYTAFLE